MKDFHKSPYVNLLSAMMGSLGYGLLDTAGITAGAAGVAGAFPAALIVLGGFLGLEKLRQWSEAKSDAERVTILRSYLDRTRKTEDVLRELDSQQVRAEFENEQDHQAMIRHIEQVRTSLLNLWDVVEYQKQSFEEIRRTAALTICNDDELLQRFQSYIDERFDAIKKQIERIDKAATKDIQIIHNTQTVNASGIGFQNPKIGNLHIHCAEPSRHKDSGVPPRVNNLPYGSIGEYFVGRATAFDELVRFLAADEQKVAAITQTAALYGLGGIGKSRLAIEFGHWAFNNHKVNDVFWISCGQPGQTLTSEKEKTKPGNAILTEEAARERLQAAVNVLAGPAILNIEGADTAKPEAVFGAVLAELMRREKQLIIFDNVDDKAMMSYLTHQIIPALSHYGQIMITSRISEYPIGEIEPVKIDKLTTDDSAKYLIMKTPGRIPADDDVEQSKRLAKALDGLPVALEQAAAYIQKVQMTFEEYLEVFQKADERIRLLLKNDMVMTNYPVPVLKVWETTWNKLDVSERIILALLSFMAADKIPIALYLENSDIVSAAAKIIKQRTKGKSVGGEKSDTLDMIRIREALAELESWSVVSRDTAEGVCSMHRLAQEATLFYLREIKPLIGQAALWLLRKAKPKQNPADARSWGYWQRYESHLAAVLEKINAPAATEPYGFLSNALAIFYHSQARYGEAERIYLITQQLVLKLYSEESQPYACVVSNLAALYHAMGRLKEAEPLMERVVEILEKAYGEDNPHVATALNNLAGLYGATNRLKEAESLMERAVAIDERAYGKDHPDVGRDLNNLARLYHDADRLKEAEPLMHRVVTIFEKTYGENHPNVATALNNLALLYQDTNRLKEAEPLSRRHLEIFIQFTHRMGHPLPHLEAAIKNYSGLLMKMGYKEEEVIERLKEMAGGFGGSGQL